MSRIDSSFDVPAGFDSRAGIGSAAEATNRHFESARRIFQVDLPTLLPGHTGQWVAYSGEKRLGIGPSRRALYQSCQQAGFRVGEFVVFGIEPQQDAVIDELIEVTGDVGE